ncbi:hypothetical protein WDU94_000911 [Cyamophila willieti]
MVTMQSDLPMRNNMTTLGSDITRESRQEFDIDIERYILDLVDEDEDVIQDDSTEADQVKAQLLQQFQLLLKAFENSWTADFLNCYADKIATSENRVKAMLLCPQIERVYQQKYQTVLSCIQQNTSIPLEELKRIYDKLESSLHYTDDPGQIQLTQEDLTKQMGEARDQYNQQRQRLVDTYPELEPFAKPTHNVTYDRTPLEDTTPSNNYKNTTPVNPGTLGLIPGIIDLILQAQKRSSIVGSGNSEPYRLFEKQDMTSIHTSAQAGEYQQGQENTRVSCFTNQNPSSLGTTSYQSNIEYLQQRWTQDSTQLRTADQYNEGNIEPMSKNKHQQLNQDVERFFRHCQHLYTAADHQTSPQTSSAVNQHLSTSPTETHIVYTRDQHITDYDTLTPEKYETSHQPEHVGPWGPDLTPRAAQYGGELPHVDGPKRKTKYSTARRVSSSMNKKRLSKDRKLPFKILTRGKTLEDFIYETRRQGKTLKSETHPNSPRRQNIARSSPQRVVSHSCVKNERQPNNEVKLGGYKFNKNERHPIHELSPGLTNSNQRQRSDDELIVETECPNILNKPKVVAPGEWLCRWKTNVARRFTSDETMADGSKHQSSETRQYQHKYRQQREVQQDPGGTSSEYSQKSNRMKLALSQAYDSKEFNFATVKETLKRYRLYREEVLPVYQTVMEEILAKLRPHDELKYNINHFV